MFEKTDVLPGQGDIKIRGWRKERQRCYECGEFAIYRQEYLLENFRNNPASKGYRKDDCSFCSDDYEFACCKAHIPPPPEGYVFATRYPCNEKWSHLFLEWEEFFDKAEPKTNLD